MMLLAATESMKWARARKHPLEPTYEPDDGALTDKQIDQVKQNVNDLPVTAEEEEAFKSLEPKPSDATLAPCYMCGTPLINAPGIGPVCPNKQCDVMDNAQDDEIEWTYANKTLLEQHPYLTKPFVHFENLKPMVVKSDSEQVDTTLDDHDYDDDHRIKTAQRLWKLDNPEKTMKEQRNLLAFKQIDYLPWLDYLDQVDLIDVPFGTDFPASPVKGDMFVRIDANPTVLYKHNGVKWIQVDKNISDRYTYNQEYIDYLVNKIGSGEYDPDLLNNSERAQIELRLRQDLKE
jgi:hypothetical protein